VGEHRRASGVESHLDGKAGAHVGSGCGGVRASGALGTDVQEDVARGDDVALACRGGRKCHGVRYNRFTNHKMRPHHRQYNTDTHNTHAHSPL
jgi:hypothetical protein